MNNKVDVLRELEVKNREIYLNKLNIDLDNNEEILVITVDNILNLFCSEMLEKILEIENSTFNKEHIQENILPFQAVLNNKIKELIVKRKTIIKDKLNKIDELDYKNILNDVQEDIFKDINKVYNDNIILLIDKISVNYNAFEKERIKDYLEKRNCEKLMNKLREAFSNMNIILYNNYLESHQKYLDLNAKTLKS